MMVGGPCALLPGDIHAYALGAYFWIVRTQTVLPKFPCLRAGYLVHLLFLSCFVSRS